MDTRLRSVGVRSVLQRDTNPFPYGNAGNADSVRGVNRLFRGVNVLFIGVNRLFNFPINADRLVSKPYNISYNINHLPFPFNAYRLAIKACVEMRTTASVMCDLNDLFVEDRYTIPLL